MKDKYNNFTTDFTHKRIPTKGDRKENWCCNICGEAYAYKKDLIYHLEYEDEVFTRPMRNRI